MEVQIEDRNERKWVSLENAREVAYEDGNKKIFSCCALLCGAICITTTVLTILSFQNSGLTEDFYSTRAKVVLIISDVLSAVATTYSCFKCFSIRGTLCCPDRRVVIEGREPNEHVNLRFNACVSQ